MLPCFEGRLSVSARPQKCQCGLASGKWRIQLSVAARCNASAYQSLSSVTTVRTGLTTRMISQSRRPLFLPKIWTSRAPQVQRFQMRDALIWLPNVAVESISLDAVPVSDRKCQSTAARLCPTEFQAVRI